MIKVGQVLIIPVSGSGETAVSQVIYRGTVPSGKKQMALTFDSGWLFEDTLPLLDVLDRYGVTATFFPRGKWVDEHKELAKEIARRGACNRQSLPGTQTIYPAIPGGSAL